MPFAKKQHIFIGILVLGVLILCMALNTAAQTVNVPDVNLRRTINAVLDKPPNARITADEMASLTHFRANNANISDLRGLEAAANLEDLRVDDNAITDLSPLAGLSNLTNLSFGDNLIHDLSPLKGLVNLRSIHADKNLITDLSPIGNLRNLSRISVDSNPPLDLSPLSGLTSLTKFRSWGTTILDFSALAELPVLREIDICGGELFDLSPLEGLTGLVELYLASNEITDISPLASLTGLTHLELDGNNVSDISPLAELTGLTWVDLRRNEISDVSSLSELSAVEWLDLSQNRVTDVLTLTFLPNLTWMGLAENPITDTSTLERFSEKVTILHSNFVSAEFAAAGPKIEGPWLWAIVPGSVSNIDLLEKASKGAATEVKVATFGATADKPIGSRKWRAHRLSTTGSNNLNEMADTLGWGSGSEIYNHVIYGSVTLNSPRKQETMMLVGSSDSVKVWLNGEVVHYNPIERHSDGYDDVFPVTLRKGPNVLLVAVDNRGGHGFSGFFGFAGDTDYTVNPIGKKFTVRVPAWDVNRDGSIDILDMILVGQDFGKARSANARTDVNRDGKRNIADLVLVSQHFGELSGVSAAPAALAIDSSGLDAAVLRGWIAQAQIENDGSLVFQQGISNLQQLLALLKPKRTAVLTNYPNPFNPETWIPYQLSAPVHATIRIYAANGTLVRTLHLGYQCAGNYQQRSRAAYWDGKNEVGESVASGLYFYTLTAGDFTGTRKMLIRK